MGEIHELFVLALSLVWFAGELLILDDRFPARRLLRSFGALSTLKCLVARSTASATEVRENEVSSTLSALKCYD